MSENAKRADDSGALHKNRDDAFVIGYGYKHKHYNRSSLPLSTLLDTEPCPHCSAQNASCYWCRGRGWLTHHEYSMWLSDQQTAMFGGEIPFNGESVYHGDPLADDYALEGR